MFRIQTSEADYVSYDIVAEVLCYFVKTPVMRWREGYWRGLRWREGSSCPLDLLLLVCLGGEKDMTTHNSCATTKSLPCDHPECGEGEESDAGEKGGAMEQPGAKEGEKGGAMMPGEPADEREEGP